MTVLPLTATPCAELAGLDPVLAGLVGRVGCPDPFRWADGGRTGDSHFAALALHIVGQQISTKVAFVIYDRIAAAIGGVPSPVGLTALGPDELRAAGLSRAKVSYLLGLATSDVDVERLDNLTDEQAMAALTSIRGVGRWSAEMFLIHQLHRPDVLPAGDIGIRRAIERAWSLPALPSIAEVETRSEAWTPHRSHAAAILWASLS